ncbi:hypothetical protein KH5_07850 [Urechidicola sp. KH5]
MKKIRLFKKKVPSNYILPNCLNCGKPLDIDDNFCSYCGQKNVEKLSFGSFLGQVISGFFNYDSRFWTTFIPLLLTPGKVTSDYIEGKRKRYVNPFQMYLHVSIIFFIILGLTNKDEASFTPPPNTPETAAVNDSATTELKKEIPELNTKEIDSVNQKVKTNLDNGLSFTDRFVDSSYQYKSLNDSIKKLSFSDRMNDFNAYVYLNPDQTNASVALAEINYPLTFWNTFYFEQLVKIRQNLKQMEEDRGKSFVKKLVSYLSIGLFIFLPLFTLSFMMLYYRKRMNYMEHLVFVFHTQTVFFLLMTLYILTDFVVNTKSLWILLLLFLLYLYKALRKFYKQGRIKTIIKFFLLNFVYANLAGIALFIMSVFAFVLE